MGSADNRHGIAKDAAMMDFIFSPDEVSSPEL
jgi:hypothetical protein